MNIEEFRNYCLSLNGVTEKMPFQNSNTDYDRNLLVFSIGDKWFCFVNVDIFDFCNLKSTPDISAELQAEYEAVRPGYHMNHHHWISVYFNHDMPDKRILELVHEAYRCVLSSLSKREQAKYL
jgi:predicted DNA-binding protein (MmcQ/YjbR family)